MGDRANVYVVQHPYGDRKDEVSGIYIYTHWGGYELPQTLAAALEKAEPRWSDEGYLTRILIDQITADARDEETGYGVSTYLCDNSYPILVVDSEKQMVGFAKEGTERGGIDACAPICAFEDFIEIGAKGWPGRD